LWYSLPEYGEEFRYGEYEMKEFKEIEKVTLLKTNTVCDTVFLNESNSIHEFSNERILR